MNRMDAVNHQNDKFYQGLRKSLEDTFMRLDPNMTRSWEQPGKLKQNNFKEVETNKVAHGEDSRVLDELTSIRVKVWKVWNQSSSSQQKSVSSSDQGKGKQHSKKKKKKSNAC